MWEAIVRTEENPTHCYDQTDKRNLKDRETAYVVFKIYGSECAELTDFDCFSGKLFSDSEGQMKAKLLFYLSAAKQTTQENSRAAGESIHTKQINSLHQANIWTDNE